MTAHFPEPGSEQYFHLFGSSIIDPETIKLTFIHGEFNPQLPLHGYFKDMTSGNLLGSPVTSKTDAYGRLMLFEELGLADTAVSRELRKEIDTAKLPPDGACEDLDAAVA